MNGCRLPVQSSSRSPHSAYILVVMGTRGLLLFEFLPISPSDWVAAVSMFPAAQLQCFVPDWTVIAGAVLGGSYSDGQSKVSHSNVGFLT